MRIISFVIENYKAIRGRKEFNPNGSSFLLLAANGKGKTSAGRAIMDILTNKVPSKPISEGANAGYVEFTFDNGSTLLAKFTENGKSKLELLSPDGLKMNTPKDVIRQLTGTGMDFNIDTFLSMQPKPRRELLEKIAGIDLTAYNEREKELEEQRRLANADLKAAEARLEPYDKALADMPEVDTSEAVATLKEMTETLAAHDRVNSGLSQRKQKIEDINQKIEELISEKNKIEEEIDRGKAWIKDNPAPDEATVAAQEELINKSDAIKEAKRAKADVAKRDVLAAIAKGLDDEIKDIRAEKDAAIKSATLPAEGLAFEGDDLLIDGLPFESNQVATSRKLIAAVQIAASMLGDIKYLHFDGAALDRTSADSILQWAEAHDLQLCLERPLWEGGDDLKMVIIDETPDAPGTPSSPDTPDTPDTPVKQSKVVRKPTVAAKATSSKTSTPW